MRPIITRVKVLPIVLFFALVIYIAGYGEAYKQNIRAIRYFRRRYFLKAKRFEKRENKSQLDIKKEADVNYAISELTRKKMRKLYTLGKFRFTCRNKIEKACRRMKYSCHNSILSKRVKRSTAIPKGSNRKNARLRIKITCEMCTNICWWYGG